MSTDFGKRLRAARKHAGLTQVEAAEKVGTTQSTISSAERGAYSSRETVKYAIVYGVSATWLATGEGEMLAHSVHDTAPQPYLRSHVKEVPALGRGNGGTMPERIWTDGDYPVGVTDEYAELATSDPHAFLAEVQGPSMIPRFNPGEYALVEPGTEPELEDDVLVRLATGETIIKRLLSRRDGWRFGSYNDSQVLHMRPEDVTWVYYIAHPVPRRKIKNRC